MTRVLVAGSVVVDFVFDVDAMPDLPEKYKANDARIVGGGCAANAAVAIARLGGDAHLAGRMGDDPVGRMITDDLLAEGVNCALLRPQSGARSSFSSIYVDLSGERQIMNFRGAGLSQSADHLNAEAGHADAVLADTRWPEAASVLMKSAKARGIPGVIDAEAPVFHQAVSDASHVAFSAQGLAEFSGTSDLSTGLSLAADQLGAWVCVTDGASGVLSQDKTGQHHHPAFKIDVTDTLGAGDVWHGAFALALGEGRSETEAIRFASAVAALKCTRAGGRSGTPTRAETQDFLETQT